MTTVPTGAARGCVFAALFRALGRLSRALNRRLGGGANETLCGRMTRTRGHDCLFCRVVGWVLRDRDHCWRMRVAEIQRIETTNR